MTIASLSGATRLKHVAGPIPAKPTDEARSITWPWMIRRWFASVGARAALDSVDVGLLKASQQDLLELLALWGSHWLVLQVDSSMLTGGSTSITQRHWVVIDPDTRPLIQPPGQRGGLDPAGFTAWQRATMSKQNNAYSAQAQVDFNATALTNLRVVSWGNEHTPVRGATLANICSRFYGGYAFPRFNR